MAKLNERNENTKKKIHIMATSLCARNCKHCCNKQYDLNDVPYVTDEELREAEVLYLTGGEPFLFTDPCEIARWYRFNYPNIKRIFVYTNAHEMLRYMRHKHIHSIDGVTVSIKTEGDREAFYIINRDEKVSKLPSNMLYVFDDLWPERLGNFKAMGREWQEDFVPESNSIFRKA